MSGPGRSGWVDLGGPVHYLDYGGPPGGPVVVCVHGLSGSAVNWAAIAPLLTDRFAVLAPDLAGHGRTRSAGRGCDVMANRRLLHRFIEALPGGPVILMGNSMGGMISLIEAGSSPGAVAGLILIDPALPFVPAWPDPRLAVLLGLLATPGIGAALAAGRRRLSPEAAVAGILNVCCADPSLVNPDVVEAHVALARERAGFAEAPADVALAARSVILTAGLRSREYRRLIRAVSCPVLLMHGELDRLVPASAAVAAGRAHPDWTVDILPGVGHVPQLEVPARCAAVIARWTGSSGAEAVRRARERAGASSFFLKGSGQ